MRFWFWVILIIALALTWVFLKPVFALIVLGIIFFIVYKIYGWVRRLMTPHGHRIKHNLLRSHLESRYGTKEGGRLYKDTVSELRKKGYR